MVSSKAKYSANIPDVPTLCCDISVIPLDEIPEDDVYHLSPPYQLFSTSGKQERFQSANGKVNPPPHSHKGRR